MGGKMKNEVALIENSNYAIARYWGYRYAIRLPEIFDTVVHQIELEMESAKNRSTYIYVLLWNMLREMKKTLMDGVGFFVLVSPIEEII
jgi:hypothetical protein